MELTEKKPFYFTFGHKYAYKAHPNYPNANPNGWVTIMAADFYTARMKSVEIFGQGPGGAVLFASQYDDSNFEPKYFPAGEIERFEA
jgi:hypothetical protein